MAGQSVAGIFRCPGRGLVIVCALLPPQIGRYAPGDLAIQRAADDEDGYPVLQLSFLPRPQRRPGDEPSVRPFGIAFRLVDPGQRILWRELADQQTTLVSFVDVAEGALRGRRRLRLASVQQAISSALEAAERKSAQPAA